MGGCGCLWEEWNGWDWVLAKRGWEYRGSGFEGFVGFFGGGGDWVEGGIRERNGDWELKGLLFLGLFLSFFICTFNRHVSLYCIHLDTPIQHSQEREKRSNFPIMTNELIFLSSSKRVKNGVALSAKHRHCL